MSIHFPSLRFTRRHAVALLGAAGASTLLHPEAQAANTCVALAEAQTEGPYWVEENLNRQDIRVDPSDGSIRPGTLLSLTLNIQEISGGACGPLAGAHVDIWHCDAAGLYSDVAANATVGRKFLRGYQVTGDDGVVQFTTIYPGWYSGRTVHIHVRIRTYYGAQVYDGFTAQVFFDDTITDQVFTAAPYNTRRARDTRNANDMVLTGTRGAAVFAALSKTASGYTGAATIGVNLRTAAAAPPAIQSGGVVSAASFAAGITPGSWQALFGQNLATATHSLNAIDLVNGALPTSLAGVSVTVNNKPAYLSYVSPTQINFQTPDDTAAGSVPIAVTNAAGRATSTAAMTAVQPAFFASGNYALAVLLDGTVVAGAPGLKPGQTVQFYGAGFGPTSPAISAGAIPETAARLAGSIEFTIGGAPADVSFAGLSGAGLYQFNVKVPALAPGDYPIRAAVQGASTQSGLLLRVAS